MPSSPLIDRLTTDLGWPALETPDQLAAFLAEPGARCLFVPGDPVRNLETNDAAVILPELVLAFQGLFSAAVVRDSLEAALREDAGVWKTPSLIFYRDGQQIGAIPKVRDWDDYLARIQHILAQPTPAPATAAE